MARNRWPNTKLRDKRLDRGFTQEELADELSQLRWQTDADAPAVTGAMVSGWERGVRPRPPHRRLLCELFRLGMDDLGLRPRPVASPDGPSGDRYDEGTQRRTFLMGAAGTFATVAGNPLADPLLTALDRLSHLAGSSISAAVDGYEALIADLGASYSREPVVRLYARLDGLLGAAQGLLDSNPPGPYGRRLHSIAGWSAGLLANALHDMDDPTAATANAALALEYGRRAGDAALVAYVRDRQVLFAENAHHFAEAIGLVRDGLDVAPERTAIRARLHSGHARLAARLGLADEARAALGELRSDFDALGSDQVGEGSLSVSVALLDGAVGAVCTRLGELEVARVHLQRFVDHYASLTGIARRPTRLAIARLELASVLLAVGRPDEGAALAMLALDTERLVAPVVRDAGTFVAALNSAHAHLPEARQLHERYLALEAPSAGA